MAINPTSRVLNAQKDIWSVVNEAVACSVFDPVVNLGQGFFGYNPPKHVLQALSEFIHQPDCNQYAPPKGRPRLRKALSYANRGLFGRELDWEHEVLVTTGANEGILSVIMAYVAPGDEVLVMEPFFDQFVKNIAMAGGHTKFVALTAPKNSASSSMAASEWKLSMKDLEAATTTRTRLLILNTPHNPTGKIFSQKEVEDIGNFCRERSILLLSDEVYSRMVYGDGSAMVHPASLFPDITVTVGSAGKDFAATGWRIGFVLGDRRLLDPVLKAHTSICFAAPNAAQEAFATAYELAEQNDHWERTRREMQTKMDKINGVWSQIGIPFVKPAGGYLVLVDLSALRIPLSYRLPDAVRHGDVETKLLWFLINEVGVAALPSSGFYTPQGTPEGRLWFRIAVCRDDDTLELAKKRLLGLKGYMC